jgi:hypothetical protein
MLGLTFLHSASGNGTVEGYRQQNTPHSVHTTVPILIVQGDADHIVDANVSRRFAGQLCARGEIIDLELFPTRCPPRHWTKAAPLSPTT